MARLLALALVLFAGSCYGDSQRIIGGNPSRIEYFPSLVQVDSYNSFTNTWSQNCAGSILNEVYILSAAHCFEGRYYSPVYRRIRAGSSYRNQGGQLARVHVAYNHPSYRQASRWDGDISVVRLVDFLVFGPTVAQARIIYPNYQPPDHQAVTVAGWGHTSLGGSPSSILMDTFLYTINNAVCRQRYSTLPGYVVTQNMFCAGFLDLGGQDTCQGDEGGPVYLWDVVVGVVSWGYSCGNPTFPSVSTAVSPYANWIRYTAV